MGNETRIEWADATWNPIIGCTQISTGCENCYAAKMAYRLSRMGKRDYDKVVDAKERTWNGKTFLREDELARVKRLRKPRRIFVSSMGDFFHENVPDEWRDRVFDAIGKNSPHTFIFLTKRPEVAARYLKPEHLGQKIWIGVTAETQAIANERIPILLLQIPAAVKFVSLEPLLEKITLTKLVHWPAAYLNALYGEYIDLAGYKSMPVLNWVICGGETGQGARMMKEEWAISIRDQCKAYDVPFFFKKKGQAWCRHNDFHPAGPENHRIQGKTYEEFPKGE